MFKHLLLPTDGSPASEAAVRRGLQLARESSARVTALHVVPDFHALTYHAAMLSDTREQFKLDCEGAARKILAAIESQARELGVECTSLTRANDHPYEAIDKVATESGCDLIVIGSHGQRGMRGLLMGSETQKLLTHTRTPVLVLH